jgi:uncharacterized protein (DUF1778 family)
MSGKSEGAGSLERVTVNLTVRSASAMRQAADLTGDTKTDTINRALQVYAYWEKVIADGGAWYVRETEDAELMQLKSL